MSEHQLTLSAHDGTAVDHKSGAVSFIGTATVLIEVGGFTILTDPNFIHRHEKVPLGHGLEAERLTDPAMEIADLPPLDFVLLSHFHGDHFDQVAERELPKDLLILSPSDASRELASRGFNNLSPLETWDSVLLTKGESSLRVTATPGSHGPSLANRLLPDVMGSVVEFYSPGGATILRLYITGDTLHIDALHEIPRRHPDINLALVHLGGTRIMGLLLTMDDEQGVELLKTVRPQLAIPIHYDDYDVFKSPLADFQQRVRDAGLEHQVRYLDHGERFQFGLPWPLPSDPMSRGEKPVYDVNSATGEQVDINAKTGFNPSEGGAQADHRS